MKFSDILLCFAAALVSVSLVYTRIIYSIKGVKVKATVKDYICPEGAYIPIMEFEYNGQILNIKCKNGFKKKKYDIGTQMDIAYIPGNNQEVKIMSDYTDIMYMIVFIGLLIVFGIAMILK